MNPQKILSDLAVEALEVDPIGSSRHCCTVVYKNRILATDINSKKSSPFQQKYGSNELSIFYHAEVAAIKRAINLHGEEILAKSSLYVVRVLADGKWALSRPCRGCLSCCEAFGIQKIVYSIKNKEYGVIEKR